MRPAAAAQGALRVLLSIPAAAAMFYYPDPQVSLLEHLLVDNWGAYASNFSSAITPCTNYVTEVGESAVNSGRTTAAQWLRVAFHDFVTGNVTAATGGLDASIGFETAREENKGSAFNDSFTFWRPFVNEYVPMADLVALGTVMSVNLCGGTYIPYRPGRVDATRADPTTGVPEPATGVEETLADFARAGFSQADSIALTACGHTIGSVHHGVFPEVSPESAVTPNNTNGGVNFDQTRAGFDARVVHEYIDGAGQMGGPLVASFNETSRSDLRLYESDGNETMRQLYAQGDDGFLDTCADLLGRMLDTVPSGVQLKDPISPMNIKPINVTWDFDDNDQLVLTGNIRVLWGAPTITGDPITIEIAGESMQVESEEETGSTVFSSTGSGDDKTYGQTRYYRFSIRGSDLTTASSFKVSAPGIGEASFPVSGGPFIVPSLVSSDGQSVSYTVAIPQGWPGKSHGGLRLQVVAPVPQPLTLGPRLVQGVINGSTPSSSKSSFDLWAGTYAIEDTITGSLSLSLLDGDEIADRLILNGDIGGW